MRRFLNNLSNELNQLGDQFQRQGAGGFPNPNNAQQQQYGYPPGSQPPLQQQYGYPQQQQYGYQQPVPQQYGYPPPPGQPPIQQPQHPLQYQPPPPQQPPQQPPPSGYQLPAHTQPKPQPPPPQQQQAHQPQYPYQAPPAGLPAQHPPRPVELPAQYQHPAPLQPQPQPQPQHLQRNTSTGGGGLSSLTKLTKSLTSSLLPSNLSSGLSSLSSVTHLLLSGGPSTCPRKIAQQNLADWFSLPDPHQPPGVLLPNFNICPSCFASLIRPTAYSKFFVPRNGLLIPGNPAVRCDLSRYWVRLAGTVLLAMAGLGHDISLLPRVAALRTSDGMDCPNQVLTGENDALVVTTKKNWYGVLDPTTGQPVQGFMICESCVGNISAVLPPLGGGFVPLGLPPGQESTGISGSCALVPSDHYDDARTAEILRQLCVCAGGGIMFGSLTGGGGGGIAQFAGWLRAHPPRPRGQTQTLGTGVGGGMAVGLGSSYSHSATGQGNGICPRHASPPGAPTTARGYTFQGFSELTVCEGCYNEVIKPEAEKGVELARQFVVIPGPMTPSAAPGGFACRLYSDRMRRVWSDAVAAGEPGRQILMGKVSERLAKERELQLKATALRQQAAQLRQQAELQEHLAVNAMSVAANHASNNIMLHGVGGRDPTGYALDSWEARMNSGVPDFSQSTKLNNEAAKLKMQAAQVESEIAMVDDEWRRFWE